MLSTLVASARRGLVRHSTARAPHIASEAALCRATARSVAPQAAVSAAFPAHVTRSLNSSAPAHVAACHASWAMAAPTLPLCKDAGAGPVADATSGAAGGSVLTNAIVSLRTLLQSNVPPAFDKWGYSRHAHLLFDLMCCIVKQPRFVLPVRNGSLFILKDDSGAAQLYAFTTKAQFQRFKDELIATASEGEDWASLEGMETTGVTAVSAAVQAVRAASGGAASGVSDASNGSEPASNVTLHIDVLDADNGTSLSLSGQTGAQLEDVVGSLGALNLVQQLSEVPNDAAAWSSPDFAEATRRLGDRVFYVVSVLPKVRARSADHGGSVLGVYIPSAMVATESGSAGTDGNNGGEGSPEFTLATLVFTHPIPASLFLRYHGRSALGGDDQVHTVITPMQGSSLFSAFAAGTSAQDQPALATTLMFDAPGFGSEDANEPDLDLPYAHVLGIVGPSIVTGNAAVCTLDAPSGKWMQEAEARGLWAVPDEEASRGEHGDDGAV